VCSTTLPAPQIQTEVILQAARHVHARVGRACPATIYVEALRSLLDEMYIPSCQLPVIPSATHAAPDLICRGDLLVHVEGPPVSEQSVRRHLRRTGLAGALLLRFNSGAMASRLIWAEPDGHQPAA
jgi:hypothetical protein